jgi:polyhydroxyalkanoate synthase
MRDKPATGVVPTPPCSSTHNDHRPARPRPDFDLRSVAAHGLRNPMHSAKHALKLGGQLGRVLLGETLHPTNPRTAASRPGLEPQPVLPAQPAGLPGLAKQVKSWIDESNMSDDDRARAHFAFTCSTTPWHRPTRCSTRWRSRSCSTPAATAWCAVESPAR